jgi:enediyne biosynthesis protein E4
MIRGRIGAVATIVVVVVAAAAAVVGLRSPTAGGPAAGVPKFVNETAGAGVAITYGGDSAYATGGGVATFDCSGDGRPDLLVAGGGNPAALYRNASPVAGPLRFVPVTEPALPSLGPGVTGAYPLDVDGDGLVDLAVLRSDGLRLLRGLGDCRIGDGNATWSLDAGRGWTTAFSATWEGAATLPTLAVGRYLRLDDSGQQTADCDDNALVRPAAGSGYAKPQVLAPGFCTLSMLFSDWDRSGRRDLRVTNDRQYYVDGGEQLWRLQPGAPPRLYTDADGWRQVQIWGMGIASHDVTGDGYPDVYLTSQGDNKLQTLAAGPAQPGYRDIALRKGVTAAQPYAGGDTLPSTAWHPAFEDVNNDGLIDLFVSKGNVNAMADYAAKDPSNLLLGKADGTFHEAADAAGIVTFDRGRGAALADFNLDGLLDLVQVNYGRPVSVWRNAGAGDAATASALGGWLALRLTQPGPNRDAVGAWIEVRHGATTTQREVTIGGGHLGGGLGWIHFGLGTTDQAEVRIRWPDGELGRWLGVRANKFVEVERGAASARPWTPLEP